MRKVTIKDLAALAGLSQATVSLALRDNPRIPEATKARIQAIAREAGYVYNRQAANLRMSRTRTLAVCLSTFANPVVHQLATTLLQFFQGEGWLVMFGDSVDDVAKQSAFLTTAGEYNVGGVVLVPAAGSRPDDIDPFGRTLPMVVALRDVKGSVIDSVRPDYAGGIAAAVDHLVELDHFSIGLTGGGPDTEPSRDGIAMFESRLREHGIPFRPGWVLRAATTRAAGYEAMRTLLAGDPPTAVCCYGDLIASGALTALREARVSPGEMSVVGFDDLEEAAFMAPPLTTVRVDQPRLAATAGRILLERIAEPERPRQEVVLPTELVLRGTTALAVARPARRHAVR